MEATTLQIQDRVKELASTLRIFAITEGQFTTMMLTDKITVEELQDIEYLEDRIEIHLGWRMEAELETIKTISFIPGYTHPAVGGLYNVEFESGKKDKIYAETFFHQVPDWKGEKENQLIGKQLDIANSYWNFSIPN